MNTGGLFATAIMMAITYASGWLVDLSGWVGEAWSHVTPGQAALVVGLLTYGTHNLPKVAHWLVRLYRKLFPGREPRAV